LKNAISELKLENNDCFLAVLKTKLNTKLAPEIANVVWLDNVFLSVLALDFLHLFFLQVVLELTSFQKRAQNDHDHNVSDVSDVSDDIYYKCLSRGFLFPWRSRCIGNDVNFEVPNHNYSESDLVPLLRGDYVMVNLVESKCFFSRGPRSCVAPGFVKKCYTKLRNLLSPFEFSRVDNEKLLYHRNQNTPFLLSKHHIKLDLPRTYLVKTLAASEHKGVKFYHVHEIPSQVVLNDWIINETCSIIAPMMSTCKIDGIISAEARGWLFAPTVARQLGLSLYVMRKVGKLPGKIIRQQYQKEGYKADGVETIELSVDVKNMTLIVVDDGIASGVTTQAIYDLITSNNNVVPMVICVIKHAYAECKFQSVPTITFFDL
jgi:adenine phosphoribosyltransferase